MKRFHVETEALIEAEDIQQAMFIFGMHMLAQMYEHEGEPFPLLRGKVDIHPADSECEDEVT